MDDRDLPSPAFTQDQIHSMFKQDTGQYNRHPTRANPSRSSDNRHDRSSNVTSGSDLSASYHSNYTSTVDPDLNASTHTNLTLTPTPMRKNSPSYHQHTCNRASSPVPPSSTQTHRPRYFARTSSDYDIHQRTVEAQQPRDRGYGYDIGEGCRVLCRRSSYETPLRGVVRWMGIMTSGPTTGRVVGMELVSE